VLDVREMAPKVRHPRIFETFDALEPGDSFILVNDHDPKPLFYQFTFERAGAFDWRYLEEGPDVWRVAIGKPLPAITAEQTVGHVAQHHSGALEVMKTMGVNHCCGAQLTLTEAAASAGAPLETLLKALNDTLRADA
jgi:regulator of cell morphogenesis and NO signaling